MWISKSFSFFFFFKLFIDWTILLKPGFLPSSSKGKVIVFCVFPTSRACGLPQQGSAFQVLRYQIPEIVTYRGIS